MNATRSAATLALSSTTTLDSVSATVAEPDEEHRRRLGTFFVLVKVDEIATLLPWLHPFAQYLEQSFYQTLENEPEISIERALGIVRQRARLKLQQLTAETRTISLDGVHYCFGTLRGKTLSLTHLGDIHAYLLHRRTNEAEETMVQWIDITGTPMRRGSASNRPAPVGAATVVSGAVGDFDTLVVVTESIMETVGLAKLERVLTSTSLEGAKTLLERDLKNAGNRLSFGALFLRRPLLPAESRNREAVTTSMATLLKKESGTAELLTPQSPSPIKRLWQAGRTVGRATPPTNVTRTVNRQTDRKVGHAAGSFLRTAASALSRLAVALFLFPARAIITIGTPQERQRYFVWLTRWPESSADKILDRLRRLPHSSQRLLVIAFLFAFLFLQSLVFLANRQVQNAVSGEEERLATTIQTSLDQADSSLIFHNDSEATRLLAEAEAALLQLQPSSRTGEERARLLTVRLSEIKTKLMRLVNVENPKRLLEITDDRLRGANTLLRTSSGLLIADATQGVFALASESGTLDVRTVDAASVGSSRASSVNEQGQAAFFTETPAIITYNSTSNAITSASIDSPTRSSSAAAFYRSRLYLLDPAGKQIWRHQASGGNYQKGVPWAKGNAEALTDSSDLIIDGDVYVLLKNGSMMKFFDGTEQNWRAVTPIEPAVNATRLTALPNVPLLYAMDATTKRIFVWNKETGELIRQFAFPTLTSLTDFAVNDKGNVLYLLGGGALYRADIDLATK